MASTATVASNKQVTVDYKDIYAPDPNDITFVSRKNWYRKQEILAGNSSISNSINRPGPITGMVLGILDVIVTVLIKFSIKMFDVCTYAFNWIYNLIFGNFKGIIPSSLSGGSVISMKYFRYFFTILMPPFGILLAKGMYGWFSVIVCIIITYINYLAGIVYAVLITSRNRYADQYEAYSMINALAQTDNETPAEFLSDSNALLGTCGFLLVIATVFYLLFYFL